MSIKREGLCAILSQKKTETRKHVTDPIEMNVAGMYIWTFCPLGFRFS